MKARQHWLAVIGLVLLAAPAFAQQPSPAGRVKVVSGSAFIVRAGGTLRAEVGQSVFESDSLRTGEDGRIGVTLDDDTRVSLGPSSERHRPQALAVWLSDAGPEPFVQMIGLTLEEGTVGGDRARWVNATSDGMPTTLSEPTDTPPRVAALAGARPGYAVARTVPDGGLSLRVIAAFPDPVGVSAEPPYETVVDPAALRAVLSGAWPGEPSSVEGCDGDECLVVWPPRGAASGRVAVSGVVDRRAARLRSLLLEGGRGTLVVTYEGEIDPWPTRLSAVEERSGRSLRLTLAAREPGDGASATPGPSLR